MYCPNDHVKMHHTAVPAHYGQKIVLDQCEGCGGLWFDALELYQTKLGADEPIAELDTDALLAPTGIDHSPALCPRDKTLLSQFQDSRFPKSIALLRCSACQGFWLNRGEFTKYQQARQDLKATDAKKPEEELDDTVKQLLASHRTGSSSDAIASAAAFLSTPVGLNTAFPLGTSNETDDDNNKLDMFLNVLITVLRIFVFKV
ncbi:MAG: Zn-finger nucleic acid-binding protein [Lysobacterales bacterium]|jgi:Zn-finger nucleic acid-binding protein